MSLAWHPLAAAGEDYVPGPNRLPAAWNDPATTPFYVVVTSEHVEWLLDAAAFPAVHIE